MRPYFAIIKDSFRAAMASRVLYVLLLLITLLLLGLAPLHKRETLDWELRERVSVRAPERLLRRLVERHEAEKPVARIWGQLPESIKTKMVGIIERPDEGGDDTEIAGLPRSMMDAEVYEKLVRELNEIIKDPSFYRVEDWESVRLPQEAEELISEGVGGLSVIRSRRLNRLLVAKALSPEIETGNASAIDFYYAIWEIPLGPLSMTHQQFAQVLTSILPSYFDKFVMSIGLLVAVLVTANMIPETFQSGSLNLLLSKPISRWGLYVAKFVGGCVFVALCACYLFLGVWMWLGLGMGVWDRAMLLSIPLYVLVFAIYFSVSAFVGLVWRSAIVSVILTLMFWAFCFFIGSAFGFFNTKMDNSQLIGLLPVDNQVLAIDSLHQLNSWDQAKNEWDSRLDADLGEQGKMIVGINSFIMPISMHPVTSGLRNYLAPVYDRSHAQIISSRYEMGQSLASGKKGFLVAEVDELDFLNVGYFPRDTVKLFTTKNGMVAATSSGRLYRLNQSALETAKVEAKQELKQKKSKEEKKSKDGEPVVEDQPDESQPDDDQAEVIKPEKDKPELFDSVGPESPVSIRSASLVDYSESRDEFAVYHLGVVSIFRAEDEEYQFHRSLELKLGFNKSMSCRMAFQGDLIVLAFGNGKVITVDGEKLSELDDYQLESRSGIERVAGSPDGRYFAVLYRNGNLWLLNREGERRFVKASVTGQGSVCSFAFGGEGKWWVTDDTDRVSEYDLADGTRQVRHAPTGTRVAQIYRLGLRPFYRICPKPSEFYKVVTHLSSSGDAGSNENVDRNFSSESADPWSPLTSGLVFMLVMLSLGCLVFQFKDY